VRKVKETGCEKKLSAYKYQQAENSPAYYKPSFQCIAVKIKIFFT